MKFYRKPHCLGGMQTCRCYHNLPSSIRKSYCSTRSALLPADLNTSLKGAWGVRRSGDADEARTFSPMPSVTDLKQAPSPKDIGLALRQKGRAFYGAF